MATRGRSRTSKRDSHGEFKNEVSIGRSLAADRRQPAKTKVPKGRGDLGDTI